MPTNNMPEAPKIIYDQSMNIDNTTDISQRNKITLEFIEDVTSNPDQVQQRILSDILMKNANVEYLKHHGHFGHTDRDTFKMLIPVITYDDLQLDMTRIANGDKSPILSSKPISELLIGSGTSGGELKLLPTIEDDHERRSLLYSLTMPVMNQFVPGLDKGKGMYFMFIRSESKTPGGLIAQPVMTSYFKSSHYSNQRQYDPYANYTSPNETILCPDSFQSMYSQMLSGLCLNEQVLRVGSVFATGFLRAIRFLEKNWTLLCHDIRTGVLNPNINDPSVSEAVGRILKPDPKLAEFIEHECSKNSWQGIIKRIWPNTKYIDVIVTGSMSQYIPTLDYYGNGLPLVSSKYASSECPFGVNLDPLCKPSEVSYTLIPNMAYFEFLPVHRNNVIDDVMNSSSISKSQQNLVDLADVKLGQEYELVVTTYAGLYRYRVGDLLRVAGFKNKAPQFNFIRRKNVALSIDADKTDEGELQKAVENAVIHLIPYDVTLTEYTSYADTTTIPGHYVIFWELSVNGSTPIPPSVFQDCCLAFEESLNTVYRQLRDSDESIGPLEIKIVQTGTFDKLMDYAIGLGASINQYKTPRCVKFAPIMELLNSRVVSSYISPKCPKWSNGAMSIRETLVRTNE